MSSTKLRQISVSLPVELVSIVDVATPTHRSRSVVVAEALQLWLDERGIGHQRNAMQRCGPSRLG